MHLIYVINLHSANMLNMHNTRYVLARTQYQPYFIIYCENNEQYPVDYSVVRKKTDVLNVPFRGCIMAV